MKDTQTWFKNSEINKMRFDLACRIIESATLQGKGINMPTFQLFATAADDKAAKRKWTKDLKKVTMSYSEYVEHIRKTQNDITVRGKYFFQFKMK